MVEWSKSNNRSNVVNNFDIFKWILLYRLDTYCLIFFQYFFLIEISIQRVDKLVFAVRQTVSKPLDLPDHELLLRFNMLLDECLQRFGMGFWLLQKQA